MDFSGYVPPAEFWQLIGEQDDKIRLAAAVDPPLGVAGWTGPVMISEWAHNEGARSLLHGRHDSADDEPSVLVRIGDDDPRAGVATLRWYADADEARDVADYLDRADTPSPDEIADGIIDGVPVVFEVWHAGDVSWAAGSWHDTSVVVEARNIALDDVTLTAIRDIEPYLAGWREMVAQTRGEKPGGQPA
ncbi:hypothetical protein ACPEEZ_14400 [Frigoribacterium sp. 2-23]|uniref:hypothetical protein n=1 Tax=Frigoribacterium sp. 2-23 TaxID=3415006 RepID=UPI003C6EB7B0